MWVYLRKGDLIVHVRLFFNPEEYHRSSSVMLNGTGFIRFWGKQLNTTQSVRLTVGVGGCTTLWSSHSQRLSPLAGSQFSHFLWSERVEKIRVKQPETARRERKKEIKPCFCRKRVMDALRTGVFVLFGLLVPVSCQGEWCKYKTAIFWLSLTRRAEFLVYVIKDKPITCLERSQEV